jgi:hypothetical protein
MDYQLIPVGSAGQEADSPLTLTSGFQNIFLPVMTR